MEFNQKLQELRKTKGLTQEELAQSLHVSRTAISKWESNRGYPTIDSLKSIAKFFSVTVDQLLSSDEILTIAEDETKQKGIHLRDLVFGLLDCSNAMFFFLPLFRQKTNETINAVSLISLTEIAPYLRTAFYVIVIGTIVSGILILALQNFVQPFWTHSKTKISLLINAIGTLLFIVSLHPYATVLSCVFLAIKVFLLIKTK